MQETSFSIEILIHDDASTDGTDEIIRDYARHFPEKIFPLFEKENQYSKANHKCMDFYNYERARGKYIAYCEGDDYWTDSLKLQKQVSFLESHPEYSVCWHRYKRLILPGTIWEDDRCAEVLSSDRSGVDIDIKTFFKGWYTQPLTMVFRRSCFRFEWACRYKYYRDEHEIFHLLNAGKGYLLGFVGGVYVIHGGGVYGAHSDETQSRISCSVARELYLKNKGVYTRRFYEENLQWAIYQHINDIPRRIAFSLKLFMLNGSVKKLVKNIMR